MSCKIFGIFYLNETETSWETENWGAVYLSETYDKVLYGNRLSVAQWLETGFDLSVETDRVTVRAAQGQKNKIKNAKCLIFLPKSNWNQLGNRKRGCLPQWKYRVFCRYGNTATVSSRLTRNWLWPVETGQSDFRGKIYAKYLVFLPKRPN